MDLTPNRNRCPLRINAPVGDRATLTPGGVLTVMCLMSAFLLNWRGRDGSQLSPVPRASQCLRASPREHVDLHARKVHAEHSAGAAPEADGSLGLRPDVELEGRSEHVLVAVREDVPHHIRICRSFSSGREYGVFGDVRRRRQ